jgi:hypothetical protein
MTSLNDPCIDMGFSIEKAMKHSQRDFLTFILKSVGEAWQAYIALPYIRTQYLADFVLCHLGGDRQGRLLWVRQYG